MNKIRSFLKGKDWISCLVLGVFVAVMFAFSVVRGLNQKVNELLSRNTQLADTLASEAQQEADDAKLSVQMYIRNNVKTSIYYQGKPYVQE